MNGWKPEGRSPGGKSGLIPATTLFYKTLYRLEIRPRAGGYGWGIRYRPLYPHPSALQPGVEKWGSGRSVTALKGFEGEPPIMRFM
jgi:hypothetical protein